MRGYCKICDNKIPSVIYIDGKRIVVGTRLHCFDCVPRGTRLKKNKSKSKPKKSGQKRTCPKCNIEHTQSGRNLVCSSCKGRERRNLHRNKAIEYLGGECGKCGYNKCVAAFDFHHIDSSKKETEISRIWQKSWSKIKKELDKCILLCSNCHREEHYYIASSSGETGKRDRPRIC